MLSDLRSQHKKIDNLYKAGQNFVFVTFLIVIVENYHGTKKWGNYMPLIYKAMIAINKPSVAKLC